MRDITITLQKSETWKIQLTIAIDFVSSKNFDEERIMLWKSGNIKFMSFDNANEFVNELFKELFSIYQIGLENSMRASNFIFESVQILYYEFHKINFI